MMLRNALLTGALALSSIGIASATSNEITLTHKTIVGNTTLRPGTYRVNLEGSNAVFTRKSTSKSYTAPATVSENDHAFTKVVVHTSKEGRVRKLNEVDLGGSSTRLQFQ